MMNYSDFRDILACPACLEPLPKEGAFVCRRCKASFSVSASGKPILLDKESSETTGELARTEEGSLDKRNVLSGVRAFPWLAKAVKLLRPPSCSLNTSFPVVSKTLREKCSSPDPKVLFIGGMRRSDEKHFGFSRRLVIDIQEAGSADIVADAHKLPFVAASFDIVVCQALLEHVRDHHKVLDELKRVLKPGGLAYVGIPFMQPYHSSPSDFRRFTVKGLEEEMDGFVKLASGVASGPGSAMARFLPTFFMSLTDNAILKRFLFYIFGWLFFWLKYLDIFLHKKKGAQIMCAAVYFVGEKAS